MLGNVISVSPLFANAELPIVVKLIGNVIVVNAVHPLNADFPIAVIPSLNVTEFNLVNPLNILSGIEDKLPGNEIVVIFIQLPKLSDVIFLTPSLICTFCKLVQP